MYLNLNGIPTEQPADEFLWFRRVGDEFVMKEGDMTFEIESICIKLHDLLANRIFGSLQKYHSILPLMPQWVVFGGVDSDVRISKEIFEKFVSSSDQIEVLNQTLYFFDCRNLISTLQNSIIEIKYLLGLFYEQLNTNSFLIHEPIDPNGVQFASGFIVTSIVTTINQIFISLSSQLDFVTKILYEFQDLVTDFKKYPKLKSSGVLFGDFKKISIAGSMGSLFEDCVTVRTIMTIRNEIVHNSSFDNLPKIYQVFNKNRLIEKFILLPDLQNGYLVTSKNRRRFFNSDVKLNEVLPQLINDFWMRLKVSLEFQFKAETQDH